MKNIKVGNEIILVKLKNEDEVRICLFNNRKPFYVTDCLTGEEFFVIKDADKHCSITYVNCLKNLFNKELNEEGIKELYDLCQTKNVKNKFFKTYNKLEKTTQKLNELLDKDDIYGQLYIDSERE